MTIITDTVKIEKGIDDLVKTSKSLEGSLDVFLKSAMYHTTTHGDGYLLNRIYTELSSTIRKAAIKKYIQEFIGYSWSEKKQTFTINGRGKDLGNVSLEVLEETITFSDYVKDLKTIEVKPLDLDKFISSIKGRIKTALEKNQIDDTGLDRIIREVKLFKFEEKKIEV